MPTMSFLENLLADLDGVGAVVGLNDLHPDADPSRIATLPALPPAKSMMPTPFDAMVPSSGPVFNISASALVHEQPGEPAPLGSLVRTSDVGGPMAGSSMARLEMQGSTAMHPGEPG